MSIQQVIDNKPLIQQIVANLNTGKYSDNVFEQTGYMSTDLNLPARNFIQALLFVWFNHNGHYCNWPFRQTFLSSMSLSTSLDVLSQVPKEHLDLLPPYILNKVKKHKSTYVLDTKKLAFDEFALATFTMWLESKKKLTSTECLAMLKQINRISNDQADIATIKLQYVNLLWQYTPTKSIELIKHYLYYFNNQEFYTRLPIAAITCHSNLSTIDGANIQAISFDIYWYQYMVLTHKIPVSQAIMTTQWSTVYQWVSNIPKSTPLTAQGIAEAIDQIIILTAAENILPNLKQPIDALRQHITAELCSSRYTDIKELLQTRLANLSNTYAVLKDLHDRF